MDKVLIGSHAMKYWYPDFHREPKDTDYAVITETCTEVKDGNTIEYLHNPHVVRYCKEGIASPNTLLTIKMSHVFWDKNPDKTLADIMFLRRKDVYPDMYLYAILREFWKHKFGPIRKSDLTLSKGEFFNNAINSNQEIEHDDLHYALSDNPAYIQTLKDGCEVETCQKKFEALPFEEKCRVVREECFVMSYERFNNLNYRHAYAIMLKKFLVNHAPDYMQIFMLLNWEAIQKCPFDFMSKIEEGKKCLVLKK